ncbi:hypothetical protein D3C86_1943520 [compost metagenome]
MGSYGVSLHSAYYDPWQLHAPSGTAANIARVTYQFLSGQPVDYTVWLDGYSDDSGCRLSL